MGSRSTTARSGSRGCSSGRRSSGPREFLETVRVDLFPDEGLRLHARATCGRCRSARRRSTSPTPCTPTSGTAASAPRSTAASCRCATRSSTRHHRDPDAERHEPSKDWLEVRPTRARPDQSGSRRAAFPERHLGRDLLEKEMRKYDLPTAKAQSDAFRRALAELNLRGRRRLRRDRLRQAHAHQIVTLMLPPEEVAKREDAKDSKIRDFVSASPASASRTACASAGWTARSRGSPSAATRSRDKIVGFINPGRGVDGARRRLPERRAGAARPRAAVRWSGRAPPSRATRHASRREPGPPGILAAGHRRDRRGGGEHRRREGLHESGRGLHEFELEVQEPRAAAQAESTRSAASRGTRWTASRSGAGGQT